MTAEIIRFPIERCRPSNEGVLVCEDIMLDELQLMRDAHAINKMHSDREFRKAVAELERMILGSPLHDDQD